MTEHNPGSPEAVKLGCTCPVKDNRLGAGVDGKGEIFWMTSGCPLHGLGAKREASK